MFFFSLGSIYLFFFNLLNFYPVTLFRNTRLEQLDMAAAWTNMANVLEIIFLTQYLII